MALTFGTNIRYVGEQFLDDRVSGLFSSVIDLGNYSPSQGRIPPGFEVFVGGTWYTYLPGEPVLPTTGYFHPKLDLTRLETIEEEVQQTQGLVNSRIRIVEGSELYALPMDAAHLGMIASVKSRYVGETKTINPGFYVLYVNPVTGLYDWKDYLQDQIGDLGNLTTTEKSTLVGAINEKVGAGQLSAHTGNTDVHVTLLKKIEWDGKYTLPEGGIPITDLSVGLREVISGKESLSNKTDSLTESSTDTQYPTAKAVYTGLIGKYTKPSGGIPIGDLSTDLQATITGAAQQTSLSQEITDRGNADLQILNHTINGKTLSSNPVLGASDLVMTGYSKPQTSTDIQATDTVSAAIGKLEAREVGVIYTGGNGVKVDDTEKTISVKLTSGDKVLSFSGTGTLGATLTFTYDQGTKKMSLKGNGGVVIGEVDCSDFMRGNLLWGQTAFVAESETQEVSITRGGVTKTHTFTGLTVGNQYLALCFSNGEDEYSWEKIEIAITSYQGGNGITISGSTISVKVDPTSESYLTVGESGLKLGTHTHPEYVNQNAYSTIHVGTTDITAPGQTSTLTLAAGQGIALTPGTGKVTIGTDKVVLVTDQTGTLTEAEKDQVRANIKAVKSEAGKGLSTEDYTTSEKSKLAGISVSGSSVTVSGVTTGTEASPIGYASNLGGHGADYFQKKIDSSNRLGSDSVSLGTGTLTDWSGTVNTSLSSLAGKTGYASVGTAGIVKVGSGLAISDSGVLSTTITPGGDLSGVKVNGTAVPVSGGYAEISLATESADGAMAKEDKASLPVFMTLKDSDFDNPSMVSSILWANNYALIQGSGKHPIYIQVETGKYTPVLWSSIDPVNQTASVAYLIKNDAVATYKHVTFHSGGGENPVIVSSRTVTETEMSGKVTGISINGGTTILPNLGTVNLSSAAFGFAESATKAFDVSGGTIAYDTVTTRYVAKETGKSLSSNDYTTGEKNKLGSIAIGSGSITVGTDTLGDTSHPVSNSSALSGHSADYFQTALSSANRLSSGSVQVGEGDLTTWVSTIEGKVGPATTSTAGTVIVGDGLTVDATGKISATGGGGSVSDVKVAGSSVVTGGVANIPQATQSVLGVDYLDTHRVIQLTITDADLTGTPTSTPDWAGNLASVKASIPGHPILLADGTPIIAASVTDTTATLTYSRAGGQQVKASFRSSGVSEVITTRTITGEEATDWGGKLSGVKVNGTLVSPVDHVVDIQGTDFGLKGSAYQEFNTPGGTIAYDTVTSGYVAKESGKSLSTNDYTTSEKNKLESIAISTGVLTVGTDTLGDSAHPVAAASDASTLSGQTAASLANQNAFSGVKITDGTTSTTIAASTITDTFELVADTGIQFSVDQADKKITIAATGGGTTGGAYIDTLNKEMKQTVEEGETVKTIELGSKTNPIAYSSGISEGGAEGGFLTYASLKEAMVWDD